MLQVTTTIITFHTCACHKYFFHVVYYREESCNAFIFCLNKIQLFVLLQCEQHAYMILGEKIEFSFCIFYLFLLEHYILKLITKGRS